MWNTRCLKHDSGIYEIRLASSLKTAQEGMFGEHSFTTADRSELKFSVTRGDYSELMALVCENLSKAKVGLNKSWELAS